MAYQQGLLNNFFRRRRQQSVETGHYPTGGQQAGLLEPILGYEAQMARERGAREEQKRQFDISAQQQKEAQKAAGRAGAISGVMQTGGLLGGLALGKKAADTAAAAQASNSAFQGQLLGLLSGKGALPGAAGGGAPIVPAANAGVVADAGAANAGASGVPMYLSPNAPAYSPGAMAGAVSPWTSGAIPGFGAVMLGQQYGVPLLEMAGVPSPYAHGFGGSGGIGTIGAGIEQTVGGRAGQAARWVVDPIGSAVSFLGDLF